MIGIEKAKEIKVNYQDVEGQWIAGFIEPVNKGKR